MRIKLLNRETHPEEFTILDRMGECGKRGHGKWITHPGGVIECHNCGEILGQFGMPEELDYVEWEEDAENDGRTRRTLQ